MLSLKTLRIVRWVQVAGFLACIGDLAYAIQGGNPDGIAYLAAVFAVFWLALICALTKVIRRRKALDCLSATPRR